MAARKVSYTNVDRIPSVTVGCAGAPQMPLGGTQVNIAEVPKPIVIDPNGWRGTIGLILPSSYTTHPEHETRYLLPEGVGLICQRLLSDPKIPRPEAMKAMHKFLPDAAYLLSVAGVDVISFNCTSSSFLGGRRAEPRLIDKMKKVSGLPCICAAMAVADAIRFLGAKKVLMIASYTPEINILLERYFREYQNIGIHFVYPVAIENRKLSPWQQFRVALESCRAAPPGADAIFFSCGAMRLVEVIPLLEVETGLPVLSTNLCNTWKCLQMLNIRQPLYGKGSLFELPR